MRILPPWGYLGKHRLSDRTADEKRIFWEVKGLKQHAFNAYHDSKYANVCYGRWLRRRLGSNTTVILHDPGFVLTSPVMDRNSKTYRQRLYRRVQQRKIRMWHAPTPEGGKHLLQAAFVTRRPLPDVVTAFFFPRQVVSWFASYEWETRGRMWYLLPFPAYQKLTWGLHASIGPQCDEDLQDRLMQWSARAVGLA